MVARTLFRKKDNINWGRMMIKKVVVSVTNISYFN